eukprot:g25071.t1
MPGGHCRLPRGCQAMLGGHFARSGVITRSQESSLLTKGRQSPGVIIRGRELKGQKKKEKKKKKHEEEENKKRKKRGRSRLMTLHIH